MSLELYGNPPDLFKGARQSEIELMLAFKHKWHHPDSEAAKQWLGRYEHLRRAIDLIWNEPRRQHALARRQDYDVRKDDAVIWNDWTELMFAAFCEWNWATTVTGPNACVAGETRIWNPVTGESPTIRELHERGEAPVVMTLHGPEQADAPFVKGVDDLYEVTLSDGSRFNATSEHRVLTPSGYVHVGSLAIGSHLFGYALNLRDSNSDDDLLARARDVHDSQKTVEDFRADYPRESHFDGGQLPDGPGIGLSCFPSRGGVQTRSQPLFYSDAWGVEGEYIPLALRSDRRANFHSVQAGRHFACPTSLHSRPETIERADGWPLLPLRSHLSERHSAPSVKQVPHSVQPRSGVSYPCKIRTLTVTSSIRTRTDIYYDITVPKAAHYFAEGAIHHNSWKTTCAAVYADSGWFASPADTIVVLTSTSLPGLRKRIWKEILKYYRRANPGFGHVNASDFAIRFQKGSDEAGVFGVATGQDEGEIQKAVDKIIGFHAKNVIVIVDEMQATNEAIVKACSSLEAGADRFQFIGLGNADSELDPHGQMSEPVNGFDSITAEDERWETKRGICIHLDGLESPRVKEGDEFYPGLLTQRDIDNEARAYGEDSPEFWRTRRGFWAPQGVTKTVLSPTIIKKFKAREKAEWLTGYKMGAGLDPAFEGGDKCVLQFAKCGEMLAPARNVEEDGVWRADDGLLKTNGLMGIELGETVVIKVSATSPEPIHFQIVRLVKDACEHRGVSPEFFALDSTSEGGGLASIFQREWSPAINLIEFGGRASDLPVSEHNPKPSNQEYDRRVTELWYQFRTLVQNGQIRGLGSEAAIEFCQRLYEMRGNFKRIETKTEMKKRTRKSPDFADSVCVVAEMFRQRLDLSSGTGGDYARDDSWQKFVRKNDTADADAYLQEV